MEDFLHSEKEALNFLKSINLEVIPVQTGKQKTPDFIIDGDKCGYLIEVKTRCDSDVWKEKIRNGEVAINSKTTGYDRWAEDVSRAAKKQFEAIDPNHSRWWITLFSIECKSSAEVMFQQAIGSLIGIRQILDMTTRRMWDCVYAIPSVYERHRQIVAIIVTQFDSVTMCVNELAADYSSFIDSKLYKFFDEIGSINSATVLEQVLNFLCIDINIVNRKDKNAVANYISDKYNLKNPIILDMKSHSATAKVF